jgi:hypothetical protein
MATYQIEFGALGDTRPVPPLTVQTTDPNVLARTVEEHARPHITPVLAELGHPEYADCLFRTNRDRTAGEFLYLDLPAGKGARFLGARITTTPERIQRKRTAGWTGHGARYVGRGTRWGNPWVIARTNTGTGWKVNWAGTGPVPNGLRDSVPANDQRDAHALAVEMYEPWLHARPQLLDDARSELAGRDLMCWCALTLPCHADVLLKLSATAPARTA